MKVRLQRFLADCGVASRRNAEQLIAEGRVRVNGEIRSDVPVMIDPDNDVVTLNEQVVANAPAPAPLKEQEIVYFLLNKPKGILVTNFDPANRKTAGELMTGVTQRVFPVGRLGMDARGALIMTNDGELANRLSHPRYRIEKTYVVEVDGNTSPADLEKMKRGLWLGPQHAGGSASRTEPFRVKIVGRARDRTILEIKMAEGKNSEIRRVMARLGHRVRDLNRVAIAGKITIRGLEPGEFRPLTPEEVKWLLHASSKEYHERQRAATQSWFEQKEMDKERKRLEKEAAEQAKAAALKKSVRPGARALRADDRRPPIRKGRKPFVPPSGRNAGRALGGNFIGRQRMKQEGAAVPRPALEKMDRSVGPRDAAPPKIQPPRASHPLGRDAKLDE